MRRLQPAGERGLPLEARRDVRVPRDVGMEDLDGDDGVGAQVACEVDVGLTTAADEIGQTVVAVEDLTDHAPASADSASATLASRRL